jgi:tetratricopeptide (TPR) repeat protein
LTRQEDRMRARRRLQTQAVELAAKNRWEEAVELNRQLLEQEKDIETYNRLGKAYFELGHLEDARSAYQSALSLTSNNPIARKNLERINELIARGATMSGSRAGHELVDQRLFVIEIGKTALTTLVDVPRRTITVVTGERIDLRVNGRYIEIIDVNGNLVGRIEPKLAQRLGELIAGGNRYMAAVAQVSGPQVRVVLRETYQDPTMRDRISFPGKLSEGAFRGSYLSGASYDDYAEESIDDDDSSDDRDDVEEEVFGGGEEEDLGLDEIEQDLGEDEDMNEE